MNQEEPTLTTRLGAWGRRLRLRSTAWAGRFGINEDYILIVLSIVIGVATGLGADLFYRLLEYAYHFAYHPEHGLYHQRMWLLLLMPVVGALATGLITYYFASEARGHGVPEVMDAMHRKGGVIRPRVAIAKAVSSAFTIGSGGSAGTEGPIVQIGAAIGSTFGQWLGVRRQHMNTLVACGVAAGIAAIFNAPIAGVLFALEIFLRDFSFKTFSPIVFASVIATSISHSMRSTDEAIFAIAHSKQYIYVFNGSELPFYLVLGLFCALAAVAFVRSLYWVEDRFEVLSVPAWLKPVIGAVLLGLLGMVAVSIQPSAHVPDFFGNGYPFIRSVTSLNLIEHGMGALLLLCLLKIVATGFTLGSGGSGGVFAPSLFIGAAVGGAFGLALYKLGLVETSSATAYAIVGMAAVVAATTHAPLTAIVILYELTREPHVILPIMFAAIVSTGVARLLFRESIYTLKLSRRGLKIGRVADRTILKRIQAEQVKTVAAPNVHPQDPLQKLLSLAEISDSPDFVVIDEHGEYLGMVLGDDVRTALLQPEAVPLLLVGELARTEIPTVTPSESLDSVLDKFARSHVHSLPMTSRGNVRNVEALITREALLDRYQEELSRLE